jgi:hypothetical protein
MFLHTIYGQRSRKRETIWSERETKMAVGFWDALSRIAKSGQSTTMNSDDIAFAIRSQSDIVAPLNRVNAQAVDIALRSGSVPDGWTVSEDPSRPGRWTIRRAAVPSLY